MQGYNLPAHTHVCCYLCAKLFLLHTVSSRNVDTLSSGVYRTLSTFNVESISHVKQCHFLELLYTSNFIDEILSNLVYSIKSPKKWVIEADHTFLLEQSKNHQFQKLITRVAESGGWMKFWDTALDNGPKGTISSLSILKLLCKTVFTGQICPVELCDFIVPLDCALVLWSLACS